MVGEVDDVGTVVVWEADNVGTVVVSELVPLGNSDVEVVVLCRV